MRHHTERQRRGAAKRIDVGLSCASSCRAHTTGVSHHVATRILPMIGGLRLDGTLPRTPARSLAWTPAPHSAPSQARRARLSRLCASKRVQNSRFETHNRLTKLRLEPASENLRWSARESSLLEQGVRRCLGFALIVAFGVAAPVRAVGLDVLNRDSRLSWTVRDGLPAA